MPCENAGTKKIQYYQSLYAYTSTNLVLTSLAIHNNHIMSYICINNLYLKGEKDEYPNWQMWNIRACIWQPRFGRPPFLCLGRMPRSRGMVSYVRDGYGAFLPTHFESGCCKMLNLWCETKLLCVQSWPPPWPWRPDFLQFTNINGCRAGWWRACIFPLCGSFEWSSSGVVGFYNIDNIMSSHYVLSISSGTQS